jgi:hypothetical protein
MDDVNDVLASVRKWGTTENLCLLIAIVLMFDSKQWGYVTVSGKLNSEICMFN